MCNLAVRRGGGGGWGLVKQSLISTVVKGTIVVAKRD